MNVSYFPAGIYGYEQRRMFIGESAIQTLRAPSITEEGKQKKFTEQILDLGGDREDRFQEGLKKYQKVITDAESSLKSETSFKGKLPKPVQEGFQRLKEKVNAEVLRVDQLEEVLVLITQLESKLNSSHESEKLQERIPSMTVSEFYSVPSSQRLSLITSPAVSADTLQAGASITFDFHGNKELEHEVTAGQVLPASVRKITLNYDGKTQIGERDGISGEFWTRQENGKKSERLLIHTSTNITCDSVLSEVEVKEMMAKKEEARNALPPELKNSTDPLLKNALDWALEKGVDPKLIPVLIDQEKSGAMYWGILDTQESIRTSGLEKMFAFISRAESRFNSLDRASIPEARNDKNEFNPEFFAYLFQAYENHANTLHTDAVLPKAAGMYFKDADRMNAVMNYKSTLVQSRLQSETQGYNENPTPSLSLEAIQSIFKGKIENSDALDAKAEEYLSQCPKRGDLVRIANVGDFLITRNQTPYINEEAAKDLFKFAMAFKASTGRAMELGSSFRTIAQQADLKSKDSSKMTAQPGCSGHNCGLSIDIERGTATRENVLINKLANMFGWTQLSYEDWHFNYRTLPPSNSLDKRRAKAFKVDKSFQTGVKS